MQSSSRAAYETGSEELLESDRNIYSHPPSSHISGMDHDRRLRRSRRHVSIGGRTNTSLHFTDDIDGLAGEEEELAKLVEHLDKASTAYGMEIRPRRPS